MPSRTLSQAHRHLQLATPLGPDVLIPRRMDGDEKLSAPFRLELDTLSTNPAIPHQDILGKNVSVTLDLADGAKRHFNGFVNRFELHGHDGQFAHYRAVVVPWLWFLTRTADCRIFQNKPIPTIIQDVFREHGFTDFQVALSGDYQPREYVTQYRETDFNFVSRLMEEEGIYYFFRHEQSKHTLVLADAYDAHKPCPGYQAVPYYPPDSERVIRDDDYVWDWRTRQEVRPGAFAHNDYDFIAPKKSLRTVANISRQHEFAEYEIYDYPGGYIDKGAGTRYSQIRIEERQADFSVCHGQGNVRGLLAGGLTSLTKHPGTDHNREYLITAVTHHVESDAMETGRDTGTDAFYRCDFSVIDATTPFRPPQVTPKAIIRGPQTAVVVGKAGEEIWTDKYGRVKVQFFWDRYGKSDENSSCWIRVSEPWAGKKWGAVFLPRIGHEVIVDFLEGDPDRPIIIGRVYNGDNLHPYDLPANQTQSGVKSRSSKQGTPANFNEIRIEDKKGSEEIHIHAEKNLTTTVENNEQRKVYNTRTTIIGDSGNARPEQTIETGTVHGQRVQIIHGNDNLTVQDGSKGRKVMIKMGDSLTSVALGSHKTEAMTAIEMKVGANSIKIDQSGITIKGIMVSIEGSAMVKVKGGLVLIN